jgi:hypothetical protein
VSELIRLVSVSETPGVSVRLGWLRWERLYLYTYSDGSIVLGYPEVRQPLIVREVVTVHRP